MFSSTIFSGTLIDDLIASVERVEQHCYPHGRRNPAKNVSSMDDFTPVYEFSHGHGGIHEVHEVA